MTPSDTRKKAPTKRLLFSILAGLVCATPGLAADAAETRELSRTAIEHRESRPVRAVETRRKKSGELETQPCVGCEEGHLEKTMEHALSPLVQAAATQPTRIA